MKDLLSLPEIRCIRKISISALIVPEKAGARQRPRSWGIKAIINSLFRPNKSILTSHKTIKTCKAGYEIFY